jgi:serine/threonine protein kinase
MGSLVHQSVTQHLVFSHYVHILYFVALYNGIACSNPGSITCMAPELLRAEDSRRTAASDIYACACVCLEVRQSLTITLNRLIFDALLHLGIYRISIYMFQAMLQWF